MAELIQEEIGVKPELQRGHGGVFDVHVDGRLIYSKHQTGGFPEPYEVINQINPEP